MKKKTIETLCVIAFALASLGAMGAVVGSSYNQYKTSYDSIISERIEKDNQIFRELSVSLKEGVVYFNNGKASPTKDDLVVKAVYGGSYADPLEIVLEKDRG